MMRSASPTSGPELYPAFIGCEDGIATARALCDTTGMAARSATFASAATALPSVPGPAVMISGRSAFAIQPASSAIAAGSGCGAAATGRGAIAGISSSEADKGSRGSTR